MLPISMVPMQTMIYRTVEGHSLTADVFLPERSGRQRPCLGFFHGGGWVFGRPAEFHAICARYARMGYVAISFSYRLSINPDGSYPHPTISPIDSTKDARSALRWLHRHAAALGVDPERIVLGGQSAGGQLAMATLLCDGIDANGESGAIQPQPAAFLLYSSNHNTVEAWVDNLLGAQRELIWSLSPYHRLRSGLPPICAFHGGDDHCVPNYIVDLFAQRMASLGNRYDLHRYPGRGHYLGGLDQTYATLVDEEILQHSDAFLCSIGCEPERS